MTQTIATAIEAPFVGLRYFDEEHAHLFFGRDDQVNDILERLRRSRLVMVMGGSGSGKSSLVRAGVIPRLKAGFLGELGSRWRIAKLRPGGSPIASLARELEKVLSTDGLEVTLRRGPLGLVQAVRECRLPGGHSVLVIADQFEELFRYQRESQEPERTKAEAASFVKLLLEATGQREVPIYVIATMRSDYLGNCAQFRDLPERINDGLHLVPRLRRDQLEQSITGPIAVEDAEIASRLVQKLLNETGDDPDQLPILQHTLLRTWNTWNGAARPLDLEDLGKGGMQDDLSLHADEIYALLSIEQQRIARVLFRQLCERDAEGREIRRPAPLALVADVAQVTPDAVETVVAPFAAPAAALLYRNEDRDLDITHESLIRKWSRIQGVTGGGSTKGWLQEEVEARDQFRLLVERAARNDPLMGRALDDAIKWRALGLNASWAGRYTRACGGDAAFDGVVRFIERCANQESARRRRRQWVIAGAVAALLIAVVVFLGLWQSAERQARAAGVALSQASVQEAVRQVGINRTGVALAHLARALRSAPDSIAARGWLSALMLNEPLWMPGTTLRHTGEIHLAVLSPDGRRIITAGDDYTARVWDAETGQPVGVPLPHTGRIHAAAFSPDNLRIVTASHDMARVWDAATGRPLGAPLRHHDRAYAADRPVYAAAFSPDGHRVVTASWDGTARVWDAATGTSVFEPLQHQDWVVAAAFSPDGHRLATASSDGTARLWDTASGHPIGSPLQHNGQVVVAAFSPRGNRIVTASVDGTARLWHATTGQPVGPPLAHDARVTAAAYSPDGRLIVTAEYGPVIRVWNAETGQLAGTPFSGSGHTTMAAFSPDARRIVTASDDNTARVWDVATGQAVGAPIRHESAVVAATFSRDGRSVLTSAGSTVRLWDGAATGQSIGAPLQHEQAVTAIAASRDGRRVVTGAHMTAHVWDAAASKPVGGPLRHQGPVTALSFNPDGDRVVTAALTTAQIWDVATGQPVGVPLEHESRVYAVAFSADGRRILTADYATARIWDATSGQPVEALPQIFRNQSGVSAAAFNGERSRAVCVGGASNLAVVWDLPARRQINDAFSVGPVAAVALSPDGQRLVTAGAESSVALVWDVDAGQRVGAPLQHFGRVTAVAFSPDGRLVITASDDTTARVWDAATGQPLGSPLAHEGPVTAAVFSADGRRAITASNGTARVWRVLLDLGSGERVQRFADLAEIVGGLRVTDLGSLAPLHEPERLQRLQLLGPDATAFAPVNVLLRPFLDGQR